ncbi:hypothetical protein JKP88DRAFT_302381 [Tribonema minus]|uniref:Coiled-coil domain-containing protein 130 n=1 Tax=Tribonema minus TaxID=303371 RepID=A0A835Z9T3_9STRA|nr:hypothetical protein JKP88DRAFT_302381 [Tribonema minus]
MSSLAAVQADGFYYPPTWEPKHGSVSKAAGSKGSNQYEQYGVIRFELPYNAWCEGCGRPLGKGTRFNAKKEKAGAYFTTTVWAFHMRCPSCSTEFVIKTDPKNSDYEFSAGIRRKEQHFDAEDAEAPVLADEDTQARLATDPMYRLEHADADVRRADAKKTRITRLMDWSNDVRGSDYDANAALRRAWRGARRERVALEAEAQARGLGVELLPHSEADAAAARAMDLGHSSRLRTMRATEKSRLAAIRASSIFAAPPPPSRGPASRALIVSGAAARKPAATGAAAAAAAAATKQARFQAAAAARAALPGSARTLRINASALVGGGGGGGGGGSTAVAVARVAVKRAASSGGGGGKRRRGAGESVGALSA